MDRWMDGLMYGWMVGCTDRRMDRWMDGYYLKFEWIY